MRTGIYDEPLDTLSPIPDIPLDLGINLERDEREDVDEGR